MTEVVQEWLYFGLAVNLLAYWAGVKFQKKTGWIFANPLLVSSLLVIAVLLAADIRYDSYLESAKYLTYLLTPATVCLAVPLYRQMRILKNDLSAVAISLTVGCAVSLGCITAYYFLLHPQMEVFASLLPKSVTTAIAIDISAAVGGVPSLTVMVVVLTGIFGAVIAEKLFKVFKIEEPAAQGLACGAAAHAIGTSKALELGEIQGAMSSLAIIITGIFTVILAPVVFRLVR